jgi:hypothetical protein
MCNFNPAGTHSIAHVLEKVDEVADHESRDGHGLSSHRGVTVTGGAGVGADLGLCTLA